MMLYNYLPRLFMMAFVTTLRECALMADHLIDINTHY